MPLSIFAIMASVTARPSAGALWQVAVGCFRTRPLRSFAVYRKGTEIYLPEGFPVL
jgi:hypothetical protein